MTAGELLVVILAVMLVIGFAALIVVLMRVLETLRDLRREVTDLRSETQPLLVDLRATTDDARHTVDEARTDLERFDKVLGSAEAIGDAVSGTVARTAFSSPVIKAAGLARGTARAWSRLRSGSQTDDANVIEVRGRSKAQLESTRPVPTRPASTQRTHLTTQRRKRA